MRIARSGLLWCMVPPGRTQLLVALAALLLVVAAIGHELHLGGGAAPSGAVQGASRFGGATGAASGSGGGGTASSTGASGGSSSGSGWSAGSSSGGAGGPVVVDVGGAVRAPGVYTLPGTARVRDAIDKAGGALPDAQLDAVNRAAHLVDGQQVVVPARIVLSTGGTVSAASGTTGLPATAASTAPVSLNSATVEQLDALDGVGPATAARIVADRTTNGPFRTVDDLDRVPGIGPAKLEAMRPHLTP